VSNDITLRLATIADIPALRDLIRASALALSEGYYTAAQRDAAIEYVFGVDTALISDGTYFVAEAVSEVAGQERRAICGCGGWSTRRTLFGGDQHKIAHDPQLDPRSDAARIRAFFIAPTFARQGIGGRLLQACARASFTAGFARLELMATLPGVPLYRAYGFVEKEQVAERAPNGVEIPFVRMESALTSDTLVRRWYG
jgi:GNAT superfamily N-acetyltransferase